MKGQNKVVVTTVVVFLAGVGLIAALIWGNYRFAKENPGGNDFLVHWMGTRSLVMDGLNPYSDEVAARIQTVAYGRPAEPGEHELRVAYPLYSVVVFLPYALINDFTLARSVWMTTLEVALILLTLLSLRLANWRVGPLMLVLLLIFSLFWYHGLRPIINGNAVILVALGLVGGFLALRAGADELAGVLFAFTTIKPQVVVLVLVFVVLWGLSTRRMRLVGWLVGTVLLLTAASALIIPNWIVDNLREVIRYPGYNPAGSPQAAFIARWPAFGARIGWVLTALMAVMLIVEWWSNRRAQFSGFYWTACLTLTAGQWIGIQTDPGNFIVLFPVMMLVFSLLNDRWRIGGRLFVILSLLLIGVGIWAIFLATIERGAQPVQSAVMFFPLPLYLLITVYWVRWWAVEPPTVWYDQLDGR